MKYTQDSLLGEVEGVFMSVKLKDQLSESAPSRNYIPVTLECSSDTRMLQWH